MMIVVLILILKTCDFSSDEIKSMLDMERIVEKVVGTIIFKVYRI